jgi:CBS-domain-containing membrane protein
MQTIRDVMTTDVQSIASQETVRRAAQMMDDLNVGAIPVIGIVSLGDMAAKHSAGIDHTLENISTPAEPDRSTMGNTDGETQH